MEDLPIGLSSMKFVTLVTVTISGVNIDGVRISERIY
jgi:hypothetical protein